MLWVLIGTWNIGCLVEKNEEFVGYKIDAMGVDWDMKHRLFGGKVKSL